MSDSRKPNLCRLADTLVAATACALPCQQLDTDRESGPLPLTLPLEAPCSPSPTLTPGCQSNWHLKCKDSATAKASPGKGLHSSVLSPTREMQEDFVCRTMNDVEIMVDANQKADTILPPLGSHSNANNCWTHLPIVQGLGPVQGSITQKSWHAQTPCPGSVTQEESMAEN